MKIGITTHYYNSTNYGGNLQAYALCKKLCENFDAEQICIDAKTFKKPSKKIKGNLIKSSLKAMRKALRLIHRKTHIRRYRTAAEQLRERKAEILRFGKELIPHSEKVYSPQNLHEANSVYDVFVTGSDQVWHPSAWNEAYRLDFANDGKIKLSYAASIAKSALNENELKILGNSLKGYNAISVREKNAVDIVAPISAVPVSWVLDPVFLLSKDEWNELSAERMIDKPYVFCYFLGKGKDERRAAKRYAKEHGLVLVTLPYLMGEYRKCDEKYGDERIFKASPSDFVSLIKNAECIFTDSFHAVAFSVIYEKEFFAFPRGNSHSMSSRITSILSLIGMPERYISDRQMENSICTVERIDYSSRLDKLSDMKDSSLRFLLNNLKKEA